MKSKSPVRLKLRKEHSLTKFNYKIKDNKEKRHRALKKAVKSYGYLPVMRRINVLYVFNKNKNPYIARKMTVDKEWLKKNY